ncbi:interferon-induced very large GTPase 1-like [Antedon mediterranea]|uniref:interferon-induced very large GTPase 1-like n=1 Tax=Antedon mediterranea TaxID=105859 RepID=UPI003AF866B6
MQNEVYVEKVKKEIYDLRCWQSSLHRERSERSESTYMLFKESFKYKTIERKYFFGFVKIMADRYSIQKLQPIREEYIKKWNELCDHKKDKPETSNPPLYTMKDKLDELEQKLSRESVGLEHFTREIGQDYEIFSDLKLPTNEFDSDHLPEVTAEMLLHGYPIELMDGDAVHVPIAWIEAVFNSLKDTIGKKKLFVLSVLGIQSSGKSTMLNAMFGLQFSVSAGRCTKGIFAQLVSLDNSLREETQCDYILVVNTKGLRSPEFASIQQDTSRDNELATLVIGLGDLTIINIMGENPTYMQDTLQIAVHAFMKMENVNIKPSCLFVHQNVTDVTATDKTTEQKRSMREMLDKITKIAAAEENCSKKSFSDVINFQENKHIMYISSLWQGDPPMAPPNPGYSKCILQVKKQVLEIMKDCKPKRIDEFPTLLRDLWKAILCQHFVISFKNSLEIQTFNALNVEYVKHARTLRRSALEYSYGLQIECEKLTADEMKKDGQRILESYVHKLEKDFHGFKSSMAHYFRKEPKACQWKFKIDIQVSGLCEEIKAELNDAFTSFKNKITGRAKFDVDIKRYKTGIYEKAKTLADKYRNQQLPEVQLKKEFATNWETWVSDIPGGDEHVDVHKSFPEIADKCFLENDKSEVTSILQSKNFDTGVLETDLSFDTNRPVEQNKAIKVAKSLFSKFVFGGSKAHVNNANSIKQSIVEKFKTKITKLEQSGRSYTVQQGCDLLSDLANEIGKIEIDEKVHVTAKGKIRIALCNYKVKLLPILAKMQEHYKRENDPRIYMECQKEGLWQMFKEECEDLHIIVKVASATSRWISSAIKTALPEKCKRGVIDKLKTNKGFSSKMSLHAWMLVEIAEKGDFQSFEKYLSDPIKCIKTFTSEQIEKMCFQKNDKISSSVIQDIYHNKVQDILNGLKEAIRTLSAKGSITMKLWWPTFLRHIDKELCVKTDIMFFDEDRDLDLKSLSDTLLSELNKVEDKIINAYDDRIVNEISKSCCEFFTANLLACQEVCPFCKALCDLNGPHDHHRTDCHKPKGVAGYRWKKSEKLNSDICTTALLSDYSFRNQHTNDEYINYRNYRPRSVNDYYASWKIEPLGCEAETFWKWFMATYNTELAEHHNAKEADIPAGWNDITMEEAKDDMKKWYDI